MKKTKKRVCDTCYYFKSYNSDAHPEFGLFGRCKLHRRHFFAKKYYFIKDDVCKDYITNEEERNKIKELEIQTLRLKDELTQAYRNNRKRNLELDALRYVFSRLYKRNTELYKEIYNLKKEIKKPIPPEPPKDPKPEIPEI